ncbi:Hypothetical protein CINCED_3A017704 [Cinara cedri]|uniref:Uncharacterized protein n=1 Tax=Cinara cedri TaxID=506608 RepID=A0A5E4MUE0_9HEMI|nr:Hypothetical protein CINCED_3A017704 [Cinara cedri]
MVKARKLIQSQFCSAKKWQEEWLDNTVLHTNLIKDPAQRVKGFELPRQEWVILNRLRIGHGRYGHMMFKWKLKDIPECDCGNYSQTMRHITDECANRRFPSGINGLNEATKESCEWIKALDIEI